MPTATFNPVPAAELAVAYVSLVVPDTPEYQNRALHHNGNTFMREILLGLHRGGFASVTAISARPMPSFPCGGALWVHRSRTVVDGAPVNFVPFLNVTPFKQLSIGIHVATSLITWAWRTRRTPHHAVLAFNLSVPPIAFVALAARLARAHLVAYVCDVNVPGHTVRDTLLFRFDAWVGRHMLRQLDGLAVITDRIANDLAPDTPYLRLDGGLPPEVLSEAPGPAVPRVDGLFVIAATGSLCEFNGFPQILEAFGSLSGAHYRLRVAGRGPLEEEIRLAAARDPRIEYRGFLPYRELLRLHAEADVLVSLRITAALNTQYAFPSKTMEYLASGIPVITTSTGHMREEYGAFCVLLESETATALADALRYFEAMTPAQRRVLGQQARTYMLTHKSWAAQSRSLVDYILQVVGANC